MKRSLQPSAARPQNTDSYAHIAGEPLYLLTAEAADLLRFKTARLFREWATRNRVPVLRRGRTLLYDRRVLEAFLQQKRWTRNRHTPKSAPLALVGER